MLAEIFILRLETAAIGARIQKEAALSNNTRFVPFTPNNNFTFKDGTRLVIRDRG
jgi:hypothetical protein